MVAAQQLTRRWPTTCPQRDFTVSGCLVRRRARNHPRTTVSPEPEPCGSAITHSVISADGCQHWLYGDAPFAVSITLAGWSFDLGQKMSQIANRRMPDYVRLAQEAIETHRHRSRVRSPVATK